MGQQSSKQKPEAEQLIGQYEQRLRHSECIDLSGISGERMGQLCVEFEKELNELQSKKGAILPRKVRTSIKDHYLQILQLYRDTLRISRLLSEVCIMVRETKEANLRDYEEIGDNLIIANQLFEKTQFNKSISESIKKTLSEKFNTQVQEITAVFINEILPIEYRDSLQLMERTLAEPELYSLPSLVMWRETAKKKIEKIQLQSTNYPEIILDNIISKYTLLKKRLQAEILKLRTYPIPEAWRSEAMKHGATHMIEGEFIFFVHPGIEEDMRPLEVSERELLPGGICREEYDTRLNRVNMETALAVGKLEEINARDMRGCIEWLQSTFHEIEKRVDFTFTEMESLHRDARSLQFLVDKNQDDQLLKEIHEIILRNMRHYFNNRIDIPSIAVDVNNTPTPVAPPVEERNVPMASGIDRGGDFWINLVCPASVVVVEETAIVADGYGHRVSWYSTRDLRCRGSLYDDRCDYPMSLVYFAGLLYVCYRDMLLPYTVTGDMFEITEMESKGAPLNIPQICCVAANGERLFAATLKPSLLLIDTDTLSIETEYPLHPIRYGSSHNKKSRYPWLQDMKAVSKYIMCLFTGSPSPLQLFSSEGELLRAIITEDQITEAYQFALYFNIVRGDMRIYISDFWDNTHKVFGFTGEYIETLCEAGTGLCQTSRPTGIFIEYSGYVTYCDMKENNCLQRL